jgi:hypothetical protein
VTAEAIPGQQTPLQRALALLGACVTIDELAQTATPDERLRMTISRVGQTQQRAEQAAESAAAVASAQALAVIADATQEGVAHLREIAQSLDMLTGALNRGALLVQVRG